MKLTDKRSAETNNRFSLASDSYIYLLGIAEDVLVDVARYVHPVDFEILDINEDEKRPFIFGTLKFPTRKEPRDSSQIVDKDDDITLEDEGEVP
ncbi:hypothetical protein Tco_1560716 [Tanacetum coccineum]